MRALAVTFDGDREAYRRLARRSMLLNVALTGFYTPIAKRRAADWFAQHTCIDGTPIETVPAAKSRWPVLVLIALFIALRVATDVGYGPPLPVVVLVGLVLLPYLWGVTAARQVNATRWRGVQLQWHTGWAEIYGASWPLFAIGLPWAFVAPRVAGSATGGELHFSSALLAILAVLAAAAFPLLVRLAFNYKRLLVTRTSAGSHAVVWAPSFATFLWIWTTTAAAFAVSVFPVVLGLRYAMFGTLAAPSELTGWPVIAVPFVGAVLAIVLSKPARAWHEARMFRLLWDGLRAGEAARFECKLDVGRFVRLHGKFDKYRAKAESLTLWVTDREEKV